jgi:HNH endonuclease
MGLTGGAWDMLRRKVVARDIGICFLCDRFGADQVDHLVEVAYGGTNDLTNLASCHAACHARKHQDPEWARERVEKALAVLGRARACGRLGSAAVSAEVTITPLSDKGQSLMDVLEAKIDQRPYRVDPDTGSRTYQLESDSADIALEETLDGIEPNWREHLTRTE